MPGSFRNAWAIDELYPESDLSKYSWFASSVDELRKLLVQSVGATAEEFRAFSVFEAMNYSSYRGSEGIVWVLPYRREVSGDALLTALEAGAVPLLFTPGRVRRRSGDLLQSLYDPYSDATARDLVRERYKAVLARGIAIRRGSEACSWYLDCGFHAGPLTPVWLAHPDEAAAARQLKAFDGEACGTVNRVCRLYPYKFIWDELLEAVADAALTGRFSGLKDMIHPARLQVDSGFKVRSVRDYLQATRDLCALLYTLRAFLPRAWYTYPAVRKVLRKFKEYSIGVASATLKAQRIADDDDSPGILYEALLKTFGEPVRLEMVKAEKRLKETYVNERDRRRRCRAKARGVAG